MSNTQLAAHQAEPVNDPNVMTTILSEYDPANDIGKNSDEKIDLAFEIYELQVQANVIDVKIRAAKTKLLDKAPGGWSTKINDRGGEVQITKGGEARVDGDKMVAKFDVEAFNKLPANIRNTLIKKGVVAIEPKMISATKPTVRVTVR